MAELPNPVNFEAASATIRQDDIEAAFSSGPDADLHLRHVQPYVDAGYDRIVLMNAGPDPRGFLEFAGETLIGRVRGLTPRG